MKTLLPAHQSSSIGLILATVIALCIGLLNVYQVASVQLALFAGLLLITGLPHGAMDHLLYMKLQRQQHKQASLKKFLTKYLATMVLYALAWILFPLVSLCSFIVVSAYHFGQSQLYYGLESWRKTRTKHLIYLVWGINILVALLLFRLSESQELLSHLFVSFTPQHALYQWMDASTPELLVSLTLVNAALLGYAAYCGRMSLMDLLLEYVIIGLLLLTFYLTPLLIGFSIYFGLWHSLKAIQQIFLFYRKTGDAISWKKFYMLVAKYTLASILGMVTLVWLNTRFGIVGSNTLLIFILISVLALPHLRLFDRVYQTSSQPALNS